MSSSENTSDVSNDTSTATSAAQPDIMPDHTVTRTGASEVLVILSGFFVVLLLIIIFIMQNQTNARISFLWMHGSMPLALALLLSVIIGALLMALAAGARVLQLRHTASRHRREENPQKINQV